MPKTVHHEVVGQGDNRSGAKEVDSAEWIEIREADDESMVRMLSADIDEGEAEAIALANEMETDLLLIDESEARELAERLDLRIMGTAGVLLWAKQEGYLSNIKTELDRLTEEMNFYFSTDIYREILRKAGEQEQ